LEAGSLAKKKTQRSPGILAIQGLPFMGQTSGHRGKNNIWPQALMRHSQDLEAGQGGSGIFSQQRV